MLAFITTLSSLLLCRLRRHFPFFTVGRWTVQMEPETLVTRLRIVYTGRGVG
jgi:hypothetical protein